MTVLNLIINGLPSIFTFGQFDTKQAFFSFKPYYKWITFNIFSKDFALFSSSFSFKPYYKWITFNIKIIYRISIFLIIVLNLIINGLPSIFNIIKYLLYNIRIVLNLIINGLPSISIQPYLEFYH